MAAQVTENPSSVFTARVIGTCCWQTIRLNFEATSPDTTPTFTGVSLTRLPKDLGWDNIIVTESAVSYP